jgi:protein-glutamine gamma-glutamyltransferase
MDLERAFRFSSIVLAGAGFASLTLTGELPIGLVLLGLIALTVSLLHLSEWGAGWSVFHWSKETWDLLLVVAFVGFGVDFLWLSQDLLPAGIHFLIFLMVNKLFNLHQRRDFLHLYAISLLQLLAAAALTVEIWYAIAFMTYLLAVIWTLLLYNLRNEAEEARLRGTPVAQQQLSNAVSHPRESKRVEDATVATGSGGATRALPMPGAAITSRFFWATNGIAIGAFCLTLAIFFAIPRIGAGFFQKSRVELIRTSGFSEKVDLSSIGAIKLDQTVVMRVEFPDSPRPAGELLYFRGAAYDFYDGRTWSNTLSMRRAVVPGPEGAFQIADARGGAQPTLRQEILLEPLDTQALFGISAIESIKSSIMVVQSDAMGNLYLPYSAWTRMHYSVRSTLHPIRAEERTGTGFSYPGEITRRFLQLPAMSPRVRELAESVTRTVAHPFDKVMAVERYLEENYRYSLDLGFGAQASAERSNPLEEFLFSRKTGYCEHYATAMVMLLRSIGIPARLLTGFLPGEWNDFGNYFTVRQRDAHAWVEVYFPASGWVTFDPTPSDQLPSGTRVLAQMGRIIDSMRLKWDRFVIQYSFRDQVAVAQGIREGGEKLRSQFSHWTLLVRERFARAGGWLKEIGYHPVAAIAVALVGAAMVAAFGIMMWRRIVWGRQRRSRSGSDGAIVRLYGRMLRVLKGRGFVKATSATPLEFAREVRGQWTEASRFVDPLTNLYCRVRFGQHPLTSEDLQQADSLLRSLQASHTLKRRRQADGGIRRETR